MPELSREELWRQLRQGALAPVYVLFGSESLLRDRAANEIVSRSFADGDLRDFNFDEFSLNNKELITTAIASAEQLPMMSQRRVVKLVDIRVAATSMRDTLHESCEELLARYLSRPAPTTVMIFVADELNGNRKLTKLLKQHAATVQFERLSEEETIEWVRKHIRDEGFSIDEGALRHLVDLTGSDLRRLTNEINKLFASALPLKSITIDLVESLVPNVNEIENFALTDMLVSGRRGHVLKALKKLLDDGSEPIALLGLISYNVRRLLMAKEMMARGQDRREVAGVLKLRYRDQESFLAAARRADRTRLVNIFDRLAQADVAMKSSIGGGGDQGTRMQIEVLVCEITRMMSGSRN